MTGPINPKVGSLKKEKNKIKNKLANNQEKERRTKLGNQKQKIAPDTRANGKQP